MTLLSTVAALFLLFQASTTGTINGSVIKKFGTTATHTPSSSSRWEKDSSRYSSVA